MSVSPESKTPTLTADEFNARYPLGSLVVAYPGFRPEAAPSPVKRLITRTRSTAWSLGNGEPVVMVDGHAGGIALGHVDPIPAWSNSPAANAARNVPHNPRLLCQDFQAQPKPSEFWCSTCGWNRPMHDDEAERSAIADALACLPNGGKS